MKFKTWHGWILALTVLISAVVASLYLRQEEIPENKAVLLLTVGIDHTQMPTEISSYEIQRASEHFANVILGWTLEPSFHQEWTEATGGGYGFNGQMQEKENILFEVHGAVNSTEEANVLTRLIQERLDEFNTNTHSGYVLALERSSIVTTSVAEGRVLLGIVFLATLAVGSLLLLWEYAHATRH